MAELLVIDDIKKILRNTEEHNHFRLHMGANISNLRQLEEALNIMSEDTFKHHVSKSKNDFSNWVNDVLGDKQLSDRIKKAKNRTKMQQIINDRIHFLESNITDNKICPQHFKKCGAGEFAMGIVVGFLVGLIIAVLI